MLRFPPLTPKSRRRLVRLAAATGSVLVGGYAVWWLSDWRLAAEARRQARAGYSDVVAATRHDWAEAVVPAVLLEPGRPGQVARAVASAKIDAAVLRADEGDPGALRQTTDAVLAAIHSTRDVPTDEGGRWAAWAAKRLASASDRLEPEERLELLMRADEAVVALMTSPRRRPLPAKPQEPIALAPPIQERVESEPRPAVREPQSAVAETQPVVVAPTRAETSEPYQPAPLSAGPEPARVADSNWLPGSPARPASEPTTPVRPASPADLSDRELLAALLELTKQLPDHGTAPAANGPTVAPMADAERPDLLRRIGAMRSELRTRGFGAVSVAHVEALLSPRQRVRVDLVNRLLTDRSGDAARVLLVLAHDESPEVRAAAISALAGSSSRVLLEAALHIAIRDSDERVGRLADPIRQRLR